MTHFHFTKRKIPLPSNPFRKIPRQLPLTQPSAPMLASSPITPKELMEVTIEMEVKHILNDLIEAVLTGVESARINAPNSVPLSSEISNQIENPFLHVNIRRYVKGGCIEGISKDSVTQMA